MVTVSETLIVVPHVHDFRERNQACKTTHIWEKNIVVDLQTITTQMLRELTKNLNPLQALIDDFGIAQDRLHRYFENLHPN